MKRVLLTSLILTLSLFAQESFEVDTSDSLLHVEKKSLHVKKNSVSKSDEDNALVTSDELIQENTKETQPSLLDKIIAQMAEKERDNNKSSKKVFKKPLNESDEILTPDPLLNEI